MKNAVMPNQYGPGASKAQDFATKAGVGLIGQSMQPPTPPQTMRPPSMGQQQTLPSSSQVLGGILGNPQSSTANLTPQQRQMLMALMQQGQ
jgi:hypothetical protein